MSQSYDRVSIWGFYQYDNTIFDEFSLPSCVVNITKQDIIDNILLKATELELFYPNFSTLKTAIGVWSRKKAHSWERIYRALTEDYSPIENYDRYENFEDVKENEKKTKSNSNNVVESVGGSSSDSNTSSVNDSIGESINSVNGFDNTSLTVHDKSEVENLDSNSSSSHNDSSNTNTTSGSGTLAGEESNKDNSSHVGRIHGNIGVTTAMKMINEELELRTKENFTDIVTNDFIDEFCLRVY